MTDCILCKEKLSTIQRQRPHVHDHCLDSLRTELMGIHWEYKSRYLRKVSDEDISYAL